MSELPTASEADAELTYDAMAADYVAQSDRSPWNALYERPSLRALLPPVKGLRILDAGCSGGSHSEWLVSQGANVVGLDISSQMVELASRPVPQGTFYVADLDRTLSFASTDEFDVVMSSLTLHYFPDWRDVLNEFHRILKPQSLLVFSTHHPLNDWLLFSPNDYFDSSLVVNALDSQIAPVMRQSAHDLSRTRGGLPTRTASSQ